MFISAHYKRNPAKSYIICVCMQHVIAKIGSHLTETCQSESQKTKQENAIVHTEDRQTPCCHLEKEKEIEQHPTLIKSLLNQSLLYFTLL